MTGALVGGRYQLSQLIGRGGFGSVYAAFDTRTGQRVALKQLHAAQDPAARARFSREAEICARLRCPSTVRLLDHGEHAGALFIAYELLEGESLASALLRGPLPEARAVSITRALLSSLGEAHRVGVVHRDVKPANVFLCTNGQAKLLDFGVAASLVTPAGRSLTLTGEIVGTPPYLAPEQLTGSPVSPASDLYAVALVLGEMLNGKRVFDGPPLAVMAKKARLPAPPFDPALLLSRFGSLLLRGTAKDPNARFPSAEVMLGALAGAGHRNRSRVRLGIAVGALGLVVAGATYGVAHLSNAPEERKNRQRILKYCPAVDSWTQKSLERRFPEWRVEMVEIKPSSKDIVFMVDGEPVGKFTLYTDAAVYKVMRESIEDNSTITDDSTVDALVGDRVVWHIDIPVTDWKALVRDSCP